MYFNLLGACVSELNLKAGAVVLANLAHHISKTQKRYGLRLSTGKDTILLYL